MLDTSVEIGVEIFLKLVRDAYKGVAGYAQEHDFFKTATRMYLKNLRDDFGEVRVLGMKEPMPLDSLYVRANILEKISVRAGEQADELELSRDLLFGAPDKTLETVDGEEIINRDENLLVLGKPGAGKTTYLKYLSLRMVSQDEDSKIERRRLPVFIILHEFAKSGLPLLEYLTKQLDICGFEQAGPFLERMLVNGNCLVLLDGLDEVSRETNLDVVIQEITDFTRKYRESRFVISCRIAVYTDWFPKFKDVEIADFNKAQIENFIQKYFQKDPRISTACWKNIKGNNRLLEIASSPLLLTLLCIAYDEREGFPPNRALLYDRAIFVLLATWDKERRIRRDKLYNDLDDSRLLHLLSRLAFGYFTINTYFFQEEHLEKGIGQFLVNLLGEAGRHKGRVVLQDIEQHYGLLVRQSHYAFSFSHLTVLEYFTAKYIVDNASNGTVDDLIRSHFKDDRWLEVFLLTVGKIDVGAETFLLKMQEKNREILKKESEVNDFFQATLQATLLLTNSFSMLEKQCHALYLAIDLSDNLTSIDIGKDIINDFPRLSEIVIMLGIDREHALTLVQSIFGARFRVRVNSRLKGLIEIDNSYKEISEKLKSYLKGNLWIARCLNSGATVSSHVREKILSDMFRPVA